MCRCILVLNNSLQIWKLVPNFENFLKLMIIFDDYDVALSIVGNVLASIGQICSVDSSCKSTTNNENSVDK